MSLALLLLGLIPLGALAEPNSEKAFLSSTVNLSSAWAVAQIPGSRWAIALFRGSPGAVHIFDTYEWAKSGNTEVVGTSSDFSDPIAIAVGATRAYIANFGNNKITVLQLDTADGKPEVLEQLSPGSGGKFGTTSTPRPVGLVLFNTNLWVLNLEGTVSKININADLFARVAFTAGTRTATNDVLVCGNTSASASGATTAPLSIVRQGIYTYIGCEAHTVTRLDDNGTTVNRNIAAGSSSRGRILVPHPHYADVLFYVDDLGRQVVGLDTNDSVFDSATSPIISPLCQVAAVNVSAIPLSPSPGIAMAATGFQDTSTAERSFLAVLNNTSGGAIVEMIDVNSMDTSSTSTVPDCTISTSTASASATGNNVAYSITGSPGSSTTVSPTGTPMQLAFDAGYLFVPNYGAANGSNVVSVFTSNPWFSSGAATPSALSGIFTSPDDTAVTSAALKVTSDESTAAVKGQARIDDTLPFVDLAGSVPVTGTTPGFTTTINELIGAGVVAPDTNEIVQVVVQARDADGNFGRRLIRLPVDSLRPDPPAIHSVGADDKRLQISLTPGTDPTDETTGVSSGIGGYRVVFLQTRNEKDDGSVVENFAADFPNPGDLERQVVTPADGGPAVTTNATTPNQFIPVSKTVSVDSAAQSGISLDGLENLVTYTFDIYSLDIAGNRSIAGVRGEGEPDAGVGLFDIIGENGCQMGGGSPGTWRDLAGFTGLVLVSALIFRIRRRRRA